MTRPYRVFVSHSSQDRALTDAVCAGLQPSADGRRPGYEVLVDQTELKPGVEWPRYLHEWMARCHAVVLLLWKHDKTPPRSL